MWGEYPLLPNYYDQASDSQPEEILSVLMELIRQVWLVILTMALQAVGAAAVCMSFVG